MTYRASGGAGSIPGAQEAVFPARNVAVAPGVPVQA